MSAPFPPEFWAASAISTLGVVLVVLSLTGIVEQEWALYVGIGLFVIATAAELFVLRRSSGERR